MAWTSPRSWVPGEVVTAALLNTHLRDNLLAVGGGWPTWSPTISGFTAQAGLQANALRAGKLVIATFSCTLATTAGTQFSFTLPTAAARTPTGSLPVGPAFGLTGGIYYAGMAVIQTASPTIVTLHTNGNGNAWGSASSSPSSWAVGAAISFTAIYEAA